MSVYNLLEYSYNCSKTLGSLQNYYRDEANNDANENNDAGNFRINSSKTTASKFFEYKTKMTRKESAILDRLNTKVVVALNYFSNSWRSLHWSLINCEIELHLSWSKNCVISET